MVTVEVSVPLGRLGVMTEPLFDVQVPVDSWHTARRVGFDVETTSRFPAEARIVSAAMTIVDPADPGSPRIREWLIDPGVDIPAETTEIHGISTDYARAHGEPAADAVAQILVELSQEFDAGSAVAIMNAPYDLGVLRHEAQRYGCGFPDPLTVVDPLVMDKQVDKYRRGKRRLGDLCAVYGVELLGAHSAAPDAIAALEVAEALAVKYPQLQGPAAELHSLQVRWKAEQAADFQEYLRRTRPDAVVEGSWPV